MPTYPHSAARLRPVTIDVLLLHLGKVAEVAGWIALHMGAASTTLATPRNPTLWRALCLCPACASPSVFLPPHDRLPRLVRGFFVPLKKKRPGGRWCEQVAGSWGRQSINS